MPPIFERISVAVNKGAIAPFFDYSLQAKTAFYYDTIAQDILESYELCDEVCLIVASGVPFSLFQVVDLSQYFADTAIESEVKLWRVTEMSTTASGSGGVVTTYRLCNPGIELSDSNTADLVSSLTSDQMWS